MMESSSWMGSAAAAFYYMCFMGAQETNEYMGFLVAGVSVSCIIQW